MARSKQRKQESEQEEEDEQYSIPEEEEEENLEGPEDDEDVDQLELEHRRQLDVLEIIRAQTTQGTDGEKLTWLALYSLKQKEIALNEKMHEEINALKDKFQLLKQPLYSKLASAAVGKKVESELYKPQGIQGTVDASKVTPSALPDYWVTVFEKSGLVQDQKDFQALRKLQEFTCEMLDTKTNHLRLTFKFKEQTSLFSNKQLSIEVSSVPENPPKITIKQPIKLKGKKVEQSIFTELFSGQSEPNDVYNLANEFYRDFCNSIYFYMRKDDIDIIDVDQSDQKPQAKGSKKVKTEKKQLQKPDCKQQ